jgi:hypothetical protein
VVFDLTIAEIARGLRTERRSDVERLTSTLLARLDLAAATVAECNSTRNLIPPEPWTALVQANAADLAVWIGSQLLAGGPRVPNSIIAAKKAARGTRPVPLMGIIERVAYRALTTLVLASLDPLDRTAEAYRKFIAAPIDDIFDGLDGTLTPAQLNGMYVVEADITGFYQYVDHGILK